MALQREEALNAETARLLVKAHPTLMSVPEQRVGTHDSIDILTDAGLLIALEAKRLDRVTEVVALRTGARQAQKRVLQGHAHLGAVLLYPEGMMSQEIGDAADLKWAKAKEKGRTVGLQTGSVRELAEWLTHLADDIDPSEAVRLLEGSLRDAAQQLSDVERHTLIAEFGIPAKNKRGKDLGMPGTVRVLLMVAAATMFHSRLQEHLESLPTVEQPPLDPSHGPWIAPNPAGCLPELG